MTSVVKHLTDIVKISQKDLCVECVYMTTCYTGWRGRVGQFIDLPNEIIQIRDAKGGSRQSFINEFVKDMLTALQENIKYKKNNLLFPDKKRKRQAHISRSFWKTVKELGFNKGVTDKRYNVSFHTLRHSFASWLAIQGTSLYEIKELMGHKSIEMTERYAHLMPSVKRKAVKRLAETFKEHIEKSESEKEAQLKLI